MFDTAITFRTSAETKTEAQKLFSRLGLDVSTALNIFLKQAIREERIPFEIGLNVPNAETMAAIDEVYKHPEKTEGPYRTKREILKALHNA